MNCCLLLLLLLLLLMLLLLLLMLPVSHQLRITDLRLVCNNARSCEQS
jgi:hypothetical protein